VGASGFARGQACPPEGAPYRRRKRFPPAILRFHCFVSNSYFRFRKRPKKLSPLNVLSKAKSARQ